MLKTLVLSAAAAGLAAGLVTAALQHATTTPIIIAAERYEVGGALPDHAHAAVADVVAGTTPAAHLATARSLPAAGWERTFQTSLATVVTGIGFALALLGAMVLSNRRIDGHAGLAFGAAGFAAAALAPALGLPPEIPGSAAADLQDRQLWWMTAVAASAAGLAALLLARNVAVQVGGLLLLAFPHIVGAPEPAFFASTAPAELAGRFVAASLVVTAVFWAVLGFASGALYRRLAGPA